MWHEFHSAFVQKFESQRAFNKETPAVQAGLLCLHISYFSPRPCLIIAGPRDVRKRFPITASATGHGTAGLFLPSVPGPQLLYGLVDYPKDESFALHIWPSMNVHVKQHHLGNILRACGELGARLSPSLVSCTPEAERPESPHSWHESTAQHDHHCFCPSKSGFCLLSVDNLEDFINSREMRLCATIQAGGSSWWKMTPQWAASGSCHVCSPKPIWVPHQACVRQSYFKISESVSTAPRCGLNSLW